MMSRAPGNSGAIVTMTTPASRVQPSISAADGGSSQRSGWAPRRDGREHRTFEVEPDRDRSPSARPGSPVSRKRGRAPEQERT